jgi:MFS family permease
MGRYLQILRRRDVRRPFLAAYLARLPISMAPLGMVLLVQGERESYAMAGAVTGFFAASNAVGAPVWGRLLDRFGQPWVLGPLCTVSGLLLAVFSLAVVHGRGQTELVALATGSGLTFPPLSAATRVALKSVLTQESDRRAAYALDTVAVETIFMGGPLLLSLLLVAPPAVPLLVTSALLAVGGVTYATTGAAHAAGRIQRAHREAASGARDGPDSPSLYLPGVLLVVLVSVLMSVGFGQTDVSIAATAQEALGHRDRVGWLFAAIAGGSALGGLWYGSRPWSGPERRRLPVALTLFCTGLLGLSVALAGLWYPGQDVRHVVADIGMEPLLFVLFLTGLCIAPALIIQANLVDELSPPGRLSEGQAWLSTGFTSGGAAGTALGGWVVELAGPGRGFLVASCAVLAATAVAVLAQPYWARCQPRTKRRAT